jgi:hypothetical protein
MSHRFAAYFAIVGTLAFAPGGAANAGQSNIPHFNNLATANHSFPTPHPVKPFDMVNPGPTGQSVTQQQSTTGTASGNLFSNVSGGAAPSRFGVIKDGGRFAVVERRSDTVIKAGFESSKAAWAWIANHV